METVPNGEKPSLVGKGALLVSAPRNRGLMPVQTVPGREAGKWSDGVEVGPPSDVTIRVKPSLNREGALPPPVVRRCLAGVVPLGGIEVFQTQRTGRVAQVGAALLERGSQASLLQGSGKVVRVSGCGRALSGWHRACNERRKSGRVEPDINNVHYCWSRTLSGLGNAPLGRGFCVVI